ncbi:hypothetical protein H072_6087 [Dactylellina haptotyla CBS 200.50]|uniref:DNA endonuclease activator Ctp1 C-terminal domain-containing protein n=1 Tax=Dactylellina haptotyla (strain CBS 200.50) TaxID=1284197 RepID=S8AB09_DACHA|nr:hypothetical protein H072_6087 [Dactylellina haptotyla CBS 200.50]
MGTSNNTLRVAHHRDHHHHHHNNILPRQPHPVHAVPEVDRQEDKMASPLDDQYPVIASLSQSFHIFTQQARTIIKEFEARNEEFEAQARKKEELLQIKLDESREERGKLDFRGTRGVDLENEPLPAVSSSAPQTRLVDGSEYVSKCDYDRAIQELHATRAKYENVRLKRKEKEIHLKKEQDRCQRQLRKYKERGVELDTERGKVVTYQKKYREMTKKMEFFSKVVQKVETQGRRVSEAQKSEFEQWKTSVLEKGAVDASDFERYPSYDQWTETKTALSMLSQMLQQSVPTNKPQNPHLTATPAPTSSITDPLTTAKEKYHNSPLPDNLDLTSDEEPESLLLKFSPTSRAIMRKPGHETLAILHLEPVSPLEEFNRGSRTAEHTVEIKVEPSSQPDWYSKYGYSGLIGNDQSSFDLDNVIGPSRAQGTEHFKSRLTSHEEDEIRGNPSKPQNVLPQATTKSMQSGSSQWHRETRPPLFTTYEDVNPTPQKDPFLEQTDAQPIKLSSQGTITMNTDGSSGDLSIQLTSTGKAGNDAFKKPGIPARIPEPSPLFKPRDPLKEIPDPNHLLAASKLPDWKPLGGLSSTLAQNEHLPPSIPALLTRKSCESPDTEPVEAERWPKAKPTSSLFPCLEQNTKTATGSTPGNKRITEEFRETSQPKKRRKEGSSTPTTTKPVSHNPLSPSRYRINRSKNDGYDYAFTEVVRSKDKKICLPTCVKPCCKDLASGKLHEMWQPPEVFKGPKFGISGSSQTGDDEDEEDMLRNYDQYREWKDTVRKTEQALRYGRHKAQHEKAAEVKFFWESDFPTTQQLEEQREESDKRYREKGYDMRNKARKGGMYEYRESPTN